MFNNLTPRDDAGQFHGHHRAELVATSGQVCWPPVGRSRWPLTAVGVEDCWHLARRLERDLLSAGQSIVRVPAKLMAHVRDSARTYGKSDPIDALAVARAEQREPDLPVDRLDGPDRDV